MQAQLPCVLKNTFKSKETTLCHNLQHAEFTKQASKLTQSSHDQRLHPQSQGLQVRLNGPGRSAHVFRNRIPVSCRDACTLCRIITDLSSTM